ncbi:iron-containing alcohol dehydrogenase [Planctomicrobium sp. SH527]|uniref:iron-containing alcohol dehydrogenase n=1 Tax=Planctomicrobium sp. SH527 TaxID=3448123 RepID=UPI003F5C89C1
MPALFDFDLLIPRRTVFGWGKRTELGTLAAGLGRRAFLIDGSRTLQKSHYWKEILDSLEAAKVEVIPVTTARREPTIDDVDAAAALVRSHQSGEGDFVLGIGGGAALDLAKAVAAMATNGDGVSVREFLEGIGTGRTLSVAPLPLIAMPTTSGTGSEATKNSVISCEDPPCKKSLRSDRMVPDIVLIDPELTVPLTPQQTAYSGLDAITQLLESYVSKKSQPATEMLCLFGLDLALPSIRTAFRTPTDQDAREKMALASFYSGIALANSGLGMAHGLAAPLGSICQVPHGLACAVLLPVALKTNLDEIREKFEDLDLAHLLSNKHTDLEDAEVVIELIENLCRDLKVPARLRDIGVTQEQIPALVAGSRGNSMSGNPVELTDSQLQSILEANW